MADSYEIRINMNMLKGVKALMRSDECTNCGQPWDMHAWVRVRKDNKKIISCSNNP